MPSSELLLVKNLSIKDTRLVQLLKTLEENERKDFLHFVQSPYHNSVEAIIKLVELLLHFYPHFNQKRLTKLFIYQEVFNRDFKEDQFNQLFTKTCKLLEAFFAYQEFRQDQLEQLKRKRDAFKKRKLTTNFKKASKKIEQIQEDTSAQNSQVYLERFLLNENLIRVGKLAVPEKKDRLRAALHYLDSWYVWEKLRLTSLSFNEMRVHRDSFSQFLIPEILSQSESIYQQNRIIEFYHKSLTHQIESDNDAIEELVADFKAITRFLSPSERYDILLSQINIIVQKIREGAKRFRGLLLELYQIGLEERILFENDAIADLTFINIAATAIINEQYSWAEAFIGQYKKYLKHDNSDPVHLSLAYLNYYRAQATEELHFYYESLSHTKKVQSSHTFYQYRIRTVELRIHYEVSLHTDEDLEWVLDYTKAFRLYIRRKSILNQRKAKAFINFIYITEKLLKLRQDHSRNGRQKFDKIKGHIQTKKPLFAKDWLLEKLAELEPLIK